MRRPRLPGFDPRHRLRDRLIAGMCAVAVVPFIAFAALMIVDVGGVSQSTVTETQQALIDDQHNRVQSAAADQAKIADARLAAIAGEVRQLRDELSRALGSVAAGAAAPDQLTPARSGYSFAGSGAASASSLIVAGRATTTSLPLAVASAGMVSELAGIRHTYREIATLWVLDRTSGTLRTVPGIDIRSAVTAGRYSAADPLHRGGQDPFGSSQQRMTTDLDQPSSWVNPDGGSRRSDDPYWTDAYPTLVDGAPGVSVWAPLSDGHTMVGADVPLTALGSLLLPGPVSDARSAYDMVLSSDNMMLAGDPTAAHRDYGGAATDPTGTVLTAPTDSGFAHGLQDVENTGRSSGPLAATLAGTPQLVFTASLYTPHWVLATTVPSADFQPDVSGLQKGVDGAIRHELLQAVPVLILLLIAAFVIATLLARRMVRPVRVLTGSAEGLAQGRTEEPVPPQGSDEIGVLAASLERMRREINNSRDAILAAARELEGKVADRTRELRARNEELVALNDLAASLTRSLDPQMILDDALGALRAIVPVRQARGYVLSDGELVALAGSIVSGDSESAAEMAAVARQAVARGEPVVAPGSAGALVGVPCATARGPLGALAVVTSRQRPPATAMDLLRAIGNQVGLALRTARLHADRRENAVLEERTRLAREIHDTLAQQLTAIVVQLEAAQPLLERDGEAASRTVVTARDMARAALHEARRSVWDLRPAPLAAVGVVAALESEVAHWSKRTGIAARLTTADVPHPLNLAPVAEVALLRILQEALSNVAKHSGAQQVDVSLRGLGDAVRLRVHDDGVGFLLENERKGSFGLVGMAERVRLAGGELEIVARPGHGTDITVVVPTQAAGVAASA